MAEERLKSMNELNVERIKSAVQAQRQDDAATVHERVNAIRQQPCRYERYQDSKI